MTRISRPTAGFASQKKHMYDEEIQIRKGAELGRFEMGSTVMLLFERDSVDLLEFEEKQKLLFGQPIALFTQKNGSAKSAKPAKLANKKSAGRK